MYGDDAIWVTLAFLLVVGLIGCPIATLVMQITARKRQCRMEYELMELQCYVRSYLERLMPKAPPSAGTAAKARSQVKEPAVTKPAPAPTAMPATQPRHPAPTQRPVAAATERLPGRIAPPPPPRPQPTRTPPPQPPPLKPVAVTPSREPSPFEAGARQILAKIWSWIIVGEEYRWPGQTMEQARAINWLVRVGAVIMVLGVAFLYRYTSQRGWLNDQAKVSLGLLFGAGMVGSGIRLLGKRYDLIAQGMMGIGLASLYAAIFAAANLYHLISPLPAFGLMVLVTVGAGVMSVRFNSLLMAILGIIGGYGTPVMLSTDTGNLVGLYTYMTLLGIGVLGISERKGWHLLNAMAFLATWGLVLISLGKYYETRLLWHVLPFLSGFFVLFSTSSFIHQLLHAKKSTLVELIMLFLNAGIFFGVGYNLIRDAYGTEWTAVLTVALAAFYIGHLYLFISRKRRDRGLALGFIALAAFFLILTVPLLLSDQWLTLCWSAQALVLLWLAGKLNSRFLQQVAYLLYLIVIGRFFIVDLNGQFGERLPADITLPGYLLMLGERLLSFGFPVASLAAAMRLHRRPVAAGTVALEDGNDVKQLVAPGPMIIIIASLLFGMLFVYLHFEVNRTVGFMFAPMRLPALTFLWIAACALILSLYSRIASRACLILLMVFVAGTLLKVIGLDVAAWGIDPHVYSFRMAAYSFLEAGMRLLDFGILLVFFIYAFLLLRQRADGVGVAPFFGYGALVLFLAYGTAELNTLLYHFVPGLRAGGVSMFWGTFALSLLTGGIIRNVRPLRFVGLALLLVAAVKVIVVDLRSLDQVYRIIAFIVLGAVLLAGAFVYIRFEGSLQPAAGNKGTKEQDPHED